MMERISSMGPDDLLSVAEDENLDDGQAIEILRNPHCSVKVAERISAHRQLLGSDRIRGLLCSVRGMPTPRVANLVATLGWLGLLQLAQDPRTLPMVRKMAERRLVLRIPTLTLGERIGLARRSHRNLYRALVANGDPQVIVALLENPRLTEADVVALLNSINPQPAVFSAVLRSVRWAPRRGIRLAMARNASTPLPLALSALAELGPSELKSVADDRVVPKRVRDAALALLKKRGNILGEKLL
jgi:hypothetical protein